MLNPNLSAIFYLISSVFFILAIKGLSSPESSRRGNAFGILGMIIAVVTLILQPNSSNFSFLFSAILIGGFIGSILGLKIKMTAMPQLVAAFHSLVGLAAVLVAAGAFLAPEKFNILAGDKIKVISAIEMSVGLVVGAITFSGSIIAFAKLQGIMTGNPIVFKFQHFFNLIIALVILVLIYLFVVNQEINVFIMLAILSLIIGVLIIIL